MKFRRKTESLSLRFSQLEGIELSTKIRELSERVINFELKLKDINEKLEKIQSNITLSILSEVDSSGKPVYTNDLSRKTAIQLKCDSNEEYKKLYEQKMAITKKLMKAKIDLEYYENLLKVMLASQQGDR
jgi:hypothetical protein